MQWMLSLVDYGEHFPHHHMTTQHNITVTSKQEQKAAQVGANVGICFYFNYGQTEEKKKKLLCLLLSTRL